MGSLLRPAAARRALRASALAAIVAASGIADGASVTQSFRFTVNLDPSKAQATCNREVAPGGAAPQVKLSCGRSSDVRYLLHLYRAGEVLGTVDGDMASGTITTWRVVRLANRDYLEIMVGW